MELASQTSMAGAGVGSADWSKLPALAPWAFKRVVDKLPVTTVISSNGQLAVTRRGDPVQRVCRSWRAAALCVATASLDCSCASPAPSEHSFGQLVKILAAQRVYRLRIRAQEGKVPLTAPALIAAKVFPNLVSLDLSGALLPAFASFLSHCTRLARLGLHLAATSKDGLALLAYHLSALQPGQLHHLELKLGGPLPPQLLSAVRLHVRPARLALHGGAQPFDSVRQLSQLRCCCLSVGSDAEAIRLSAAIACRQLPLLRYLSVEDERDDPQEQWLQTSLPGLERLPLRRLHLDGLLPKQAWLCTQLTSLMCSNARMGPLPPALGLGSGAAACTALQRLGLRGCELNGGLFPPALCAALGQLTQLQLLECVSADAEECGGGQGKKARLDPADMRRVSLPPEASQLSSLQVLAISSCQLSRASLDALKPLDRLRELHLPDCELHFLPEGPYLSGLTCLDLAGNSFDQPVPFSATAAVGLKALRISCTHPVSRCCTVEIEDWQDLRTKLRSFCRLKCVAVEEDVGNVDDEVATLLELLEEDIGLGGWENMSAEELDQCDLRDMSDDEDEIGSDEDGDEEMEEEE